MTDHDLDSMPNQDRSLEARIASTLEDGCAGLDPTLHRRLDRIRAEALNTNAGELSGQSWLGSWFGSPWKPLPAGLAAASVALALAVVLVDRAPQTETPPLTADLDLLTDPRFELFIEDPEFVAWIVEAEPETSSTENSG